MVDDMNNNSPKIKSFDKNVSDDDPFRNLLTDSEKVNFWDYKLEDRICAQSGQDHNIKQQFKDVKTSIERIPELFSLRKNTTEIPTDNRRYGTSHTQALNCRHCGAHVIVEVTTKVYNLEQYVEDEKVEHGHPIDPDTRCDALERVSIEARLLDKWDSGDHVYLVKQNKGELDLGW